MTFSTSPIASALSHSYRFERELGKGGMATVFLAEDLRHHRRVAIKVLQPGLALPLGADRFLREIDIAARLTHPHILPLLDSGQAEGHLYYVMPFVEGESLRDRMSREGQIAIPDALRILRDVADALGEAHALGIIHRDIKPQNVLLHGRHALVADFGVAKAIGEAAGPERLTTAGVALGTPAYMAPEQATADPQVDHRADLYAFGVMAYEMLAGQLPFMQKSAAGVLSAHVLERPDPVTRHRPGVPAAVAALVMRCLEKDPSDRWQSADDLVTQLEAHITPSGGTAPAAIRATASRTLRTLRRSVTSTRTVVVLVLLVVAGVSLATVKRKLDVRRARLEGIPLIQRLVDEGETLRAYAVAKQLWALVPDDATLSALWPRFSVPVTILSEPAGARVFRQDYGAASDSWEYLGMTPISEVLFPASYPLYSVLRVDLGGFESVYDVLGPLPGAAPEWQYQLDTAGALPKDMVRVRGGTFTNFLVGLDHLEPLMLGDFLIDRYEVTNSQFKEFVDSGAYRKEVYWEHPFIREGQPLSWADAMAEFTDRTGRPGPATWEAGDYPRGRGDHPVAGVSWYEAAAYAKFAGKSLPTVYHWSRAALPRATGEIIHRSNLEGREGDTAPVGKYRGMGSSGVLDMAGNVREWAWNESQGGRYILGGGWSDPDYAFNDAIVQLPFDRSPTNGIRLVMYLKPESNLATASRPVDRPRRDFASERPVEEAVFQIYRRMYAYDQTALHAVVEETDTSARDWVRERITYTAAYGNERMAAYLFLPRNTPPPYQAVVFFPGSGAILTRSSQSIFPSYFDFLLKNGRAVLFPILRGTYERGTGLRSDYPDETNVYREHVISWAKDLGRSLDYLETRQDISSDRFAYYGLSWGAAMGAIMLAVEPRFKAGVLYIAGLYVQRAQPEVEPINFLPRIRMPVLMLNGRNDFYFPVATSQEPMFRLLGTPIEHKRHVVAEGGHNVPRPLLIKETLDWLDRYLGAVTARD